MIVVANYKMNLLKKDCKKFVSKINNLKKLDTSLVLCPPFVFLPFFSKNIGRFELGAQDLSAYDTGKCTGQISASMLKEFNVNYCIVGHSDRRGHESNAEIANKVKMALTHNIVPIVCVGEKVKDEEESKMLKQIETAVSKVNADEKIIFAYEPVWAIGSGDTPTNEYINNKVLLIKKTAKSFGINPIVLYGGSVDNINCLTLKKCKIDGFLVGSVALNIDNFVDMLEKL